MGKVFKTSEDIADRIIDEFNNIGLAQYGINIRIMSKRKAPEIIKVTKANDTLEYAMGEDDLICVYVYEDAFDRLGDTEKQKKLIEMAFSVVSYDSEKDKIIVDNNPLHPIFNMRRKYGEEALDLAETADLLIAQIEEEEKERKKAMKENKKKK